MRLAYRHLTLLLALTAAGFGCSAESSSASGAVDLGEFPNTGKADGVVAVDVPFAVQPGTVDGEPGATGLFSFRTCGRLSITTAQDRARSWERLQIVAESATYRRRSWRGRSPYIDIPSDRNDGCVDYTLTLLDWGDQPAFGTLHVETEPPPDPVGVDVVFNQPDCDDGCTDKTGGLRDAIIRAIQSSRHTIDLAVYGLDDPPIVEALCNAAQAGVHVRVITDDTSADPNDSRSYYAAFFGPHGLTACGVHADVVRSSGLMHDKFMLIDQGTPDALLITGSTNFTTAGLEHNHNHSDFIRGMPEVFQTYENEVDQLARHCATDRLDGRNRCGECTPACTENVSAEGPWDEGGIEASVYFSPADDALRALRGAAVTRFRDQEDPACMGPDATCICRTSGSRWSCEYCAQDDSGWGLLGEAQHRILVDTYSMTDQCLALDLVRAARRGVDVMTIWDFVRSGSAYSRDDYLCAEGIPTLISNWGGGSAQVRNHHKTVVVDDAVFDGSMNLSASGAHDNNENSLVLRGAGLADTFAQKIHAEADLLARDGVVPRAADECRCSDLVDNDGDGVADAADADCDGAGSRADSI